MTKQRNIGLDILRGVAIVLVLFRHGDYPNFLHSIGWIGVDLFFVLSGFLVSDLLFKEYKESGSIRLKRFMIRRSLKIIPSFYFFTAILISFLWFFDDIKIEWSNVFHEAVYIQNYLPGIHGHSWSLAIEEQFYIGFALLMYLAFKMKWLDKIPFVIVTLAAMILTVVLLRLDPSEAHRNGFIATHLRIDGILIGVLCSYCIHFTNLGSFLRKYWWQLLLFGTLLLLPILLEISTSALTLTLSLFAMNLGFACFVVFASFEDLYAKPLSYPIILFSAKIAAFVGLHSYTIYLWHPSIKYAIHAYNIPEWLAIIEYFVLSIGIGIAISLVIERPILRIRNRLFK